MSGVVSRVRETLRNARDLFRDGRLAPPWRTPFEVALAEPRVSLRRYARTPAADAPASPLLLVPPLMVTAEIYDISPELSAVGLLRGAGADVWLADFGTPEAQAGGLERTLDDHILAISACIDHIQAATRRPVHLVGYSQGGLFCYQAAAFRRSAGIASVTAFGAPVDIRRNVPFGMHDSLAARLIQFLRRLLDRPVGAVRGIPGTFSSKVFKLLAPRQELRHLIETLGLLHDRDALIALEPQRRFLGGEGFIAWPGPALRSFIDQFIVQNRLKQGGFVVAGRSVSLADITCPILCFVGTRDDLALPAAVRGIRAAAPDAPLHVVELPVGHFGLVVGRRALKDSWPEVLAFTARLDGTRPGGPPEATPDAFRERPERRPGSLRAGLWRRLGQVSASALDSFDSLGDAVPRRLRQLGLRDDSVQSFARILRRRARTTPDAPFFAYGGRVTSHREADRRVTAILRALVSAGVRPGDRVALALPSGPELLTSLGALNRLGAVAVVLPAAPSGMVDGLSDAAFVVSAPGAPAPALPGAVQLTLGPPARTLGSPARGAASVASAKSAVSLDALLADAASLEAAFAEQSLPPAWRPNGARAAELALLLPDPPGGLREVSNARWLRSALRTSERLALRPGDTALSLLPLHTAPGLLHAVGAALVAGARLSLAELGSPEDFLPLARNQGATVVFLDAAMARAVLAARPRANETSHPITRFAGPDLDRPLAERLRARFGEKVRVVRVGGRRSSR